MKLHNYETGDFIRTATTEELKRSIDAATRDGGAGVITVDGVRCYVEGEPEHQMNVVTRREWIEVMGEGTDAQKLWEGMLGPVMVGQPSWRNASLDCPATFISGYQAEQYCRRVGGRLPTIAEYRALNIPLGVRGEWGEGPPVGGLVCEWVLNPDAPQGTGSSGAWCIVDHAWWHCREYAERRNIAAQDGAMKGDATGFRVVY